MLTAHYGAAVATAIGEAHERGSTRPEDTAVDRHNNAVGRDYGAANADELRAMPISAAARHLCSVAVPLWRSGELHVTERNAG